ncbi:putative addiction module component, TIGR02574 family [Algoriphagus alkaliphilus]|uniref:Putative addiction module component, TIGR02574 family n=1 Tax=Algoriphagus alkaliphilus TaxID=279824 RepID=A0A1G5UXW2_9BACT|nr:addiction module protein [Algoriphagus alkaliphilus]MBA4300736.1 addiction module component [Cyclobacterium sp.]SDA38481.1 putative addiction module component, TIGR02574 family [Algoriphagus alkaliphilus]
MDVVSLKLDLIKWLSHLQDEAILKKIHSIKKANDQEIGLTSEQLEELDRRLDKYERGEMNFSTWENVKARVKSRAKNEN